MAAGLMISGTQVPGWLALSVGVAAVLYKDFRSTGHRVVKRDRIRLAPFITAAILFCLTSGGSALEIDTSAAPMCHSIEPTHAAVHQILQHYDNGLTSRRHLDEDTTRFPPKDTQSLISELFAGGSLSVDMMDTTSHMVAFSPGIKTDRHIPWGKLAPDTNLNLGLQHVGQRNHRSTRLYSCSSPNK